MGKIFTVRDMKRCVEEKRMWAERKAEAEAEAEATAVAEAEEEQKILEKYPEIGILNRHNPVMLLPENAGWTRVYYVYPKHGDYLENTDLKKLVEALRR